MIGTLLAVYRRNARWLRWAFGLAMIGLLFVYFDPATIVTQLRGVDWRLAGPAIAGLVAAHVIAALTWRYLAARLAGMDVRPWFAIRSYYAGQSFGGLTPANLGADAYRAHALDASHAGWSRVLFPIVVQRITSYVGLALMGLVATLFVPVPPLARAGLILVPVVTLGLIVAWVVAGRRITLPFLSLQRPGDGVATGAPLWRAVAGATALAAVFHGAGIAMSYVLLRSVAGDLPAGEAIAALTVARVSTVLPFTPNGLGVQEAALALLLPAVGTTGEVAVAVAALNRLAMLATMVVGLGALSAGGGTRMASPSRPVPADPVTVPVEPQATPSGVRGR